MSMTLSPIPEIAVAAGMAVSLTPADVQAVALPVAYYEQTETAAPESGASGTAEPAPQISQAQLQDELDSALQKSGLRAEIENEKSGLMIVRFLQADTGAVVLQFPTQTVLDLVAGLTPAGPESFPALAGHLYDRNA